MSAREVVMWFELTTQPRAEDADVAPVAAPLAVARLAHPAPRRARAVHFAAAQVESVAPLAPVTEAASESAPAQRPRALPDISPLAAARSLADEPASTPTAGARAPVRDAGQEARLADGIPGLVREVGGVLGRGVENLAQDLQSAALRPWDLIAQPLPKGRYRYRGVGFDAVIRADGSVVYRNKDGVHLSMGSYITPNSSAKRAERGALDVGGSLGLGDPSVWAKKLAGKDPHAGERRWFLERTRGLRDLLRERAESERLGAAL